MYEQLKKSKKHKDGLLVKREGEINIELDLLSLAEKFRSDLKKNKKIPLLEVFNALEIRDKVLFPSILEKGNLVFDKTLKRYWVGSWISAQSEYSTLVPTQVLQKIIEIGEL